MSKEAARSLLSDERSGGHAMTDSAVKKFANSIIDELVHQTKMGSHETAALLFRGDAFVMYGKEDTEKDQLHGPTNEAVKEQENQMEM